jgi:hypothetical protein
MGFGSTAKLAWQEELGSTGLCHGNQDLLFLSIL